MRLAQRLGTSTIAEGVETEEQFKYLRGIGCECIQGYYFSKPLPEDEFIEFAKNNASKKLKKVGSDVLATITEMATATEKKVVLVVDDNAINRTVLHACIDPRLYTVVEAENGQDVLEKLRIKRGNGLPGADIVPLDIVMPVMNGFDFLESARKDKDLASLPVVVLTSDETYENEIMALEAGADDYLKKPYNTTIINLKIKKLLDMRDLTTINRSISTLVNSLPSGIAIVELGDEEHVLYVSDTLASMYGMQAEEYIKSCENNFLRFVVASDRVAVRATFSNAAEQEGGDEISYRAIMNDGTIAWHHLKLRFVRWEGGSAIYYVDISDITEQREMQLQLESQAERYRLILETSDAIAFDYDVVSDVLEYDKSNAGAELQHFRIDGYIAHLSESKFVRKDFVDKYREACKTAFIQPMRASIEYPYQTSDGTYRLGRTCYQSIADDTGKVYRIVGRLEDLQDAQNILNNGKV